MEFAELHSSNAPTQTAIDCQPGIQDRVVTKALHQLNQELENCVLERTIELASAIERLQQEIANREQVQQELLLAKERLQYLLSSSPTVIYSSTPTGDWRTTFISENVRALLGYEARVFLEDPSFWVNRLHPEDRSRLFAFVPSQLESEKFTHEYRFLHADGTYRWIRDDLRLVRDAAGNPLEIVGSLQDITDHKQAETALRESQQELADFLENGSVGLHCVGPDGTILWANQWELDLLGYTREEYIGHHIAEFHADREKIDDILRRLSHNETLCDYEARLRCKNGSIHYVHINSNVLWKDGTFIHTRCFTRDITSGKLAEASLAKRDRFLTALVEVQRQLLASPVDRNLYSELLAILGPVSDASRIYVFENHHDGTGQLLMSQRAEWCAAGIQPQIDNPTLQNLSYNDFFPRWASSLAKGDIVQGIVAEFPQSERLILEAHGILSILILPLMVNGEFFGFIGFDNCLEARTWQPLEVGLLSSAAAAIAQAKERELTEKAWQLAQSQLQVVLDAVPGLVSWISSDLHYLGVNRHLASCYNLPPESFVGTKVGFLEDNHDLAEFLRQFFASLLQTDSRILTLGLNGHSRNYLIIAQKYQQGEVCVAVGIDITERQRAEEQLIASLREKEVLLKEIHHRVKNNLYVVSSLLELQADSLADDEIAKMFEDSQNRIYSMALIHEKLYRSQDLAQIHFGDYLQDLVYNLFDSYNVNPERIQLQLNAEPIFLNIETATPCGLIINELVSNSLKHAFPNDRKGRISVECSLNHSKEIHLSIKDNGIGFPEDLDFRRTESMGFQVVCTLTQQLKGTIELERGNGTAFHLKFSQLNYRKRF